MNEQARVDAMDWHPNPDVLVLSAARSLGSALAKARASMAKWIVLVRDHPHSGETYYYVFRKDEFESFDVGDPGRLEMPAAIAMDMHEWTSSGVTHNRRPVGEWQGESGPAAMRAVDLDLDGNIRQIGEIGYEEAARGGNGAPPSEDLEELLGSERGGGTRSGGEDTRSGGEGTRSGGEGAPGGDADRIDVTLSAETNQQVQMGQQQMVVFKAELTAEARPLATSTSAPTQKDEEIVVSLSVQNDALELLNPEPQSIRPPRPGAPRTGFFQVRAVRAGVCRLAVRFRQGGTDLAAIPLTVEVVEQAAVACPVQADAVAVSRDPADDEKLTVTVEQRKEGDQVFYEYMLFSEPFNLHGRRFRSQPLQDRGGGPAASIQAYVKRLYEQVTRKLESNDLARDLKLLAREVRALGANLSEELFEPEVVRTLWPLRDQIDLVQVISWEPYIPWEMVRLKHPDSGEIDDRYLAEYGLVRTLSSTSPPKSLARGTWRYHRARFPSGAFPAVGAEVDYFTNAGPGTLRARNVEPLALGEDKDAFYDVIIDGDFDVLHLACHAEADEDAIDRAQLIVGEFTDSGGTNRLVTVGPSVFKAEARWRQRHPLVFLNACETGRGGALLTAWGGWPNVFLECGAGAFVGSAWSVRDGPASLFAKAFYESLLDGRTLAQAAKDARKAARTSASGNVLDASWLAFKVYGHPRATMPRAPDGSGARNVRGG